MQQIINFLIRFKHFLLFLILFLLSINLTVSSHHYHRSKFISSTNDFTGFVFNIKTNVSDYFKLKTRNKNLIHENWVLKNKLSLLETHLDSLSENNFPKPKTTNPYRYARVINNSYSKTKNYLTLNKGEDQGLKKYQGVFTSKGIVGFVDGVSKNYARVISVLNTEIRINAKLKKSNHHGILQWQGGNPNIVQLLDIPRLAPVVKGDTITTGGRSTIFPMGIPIGEIVDFKMDTGGNFFMIDLKLFNDMRNIGSVYIYENADASEILELEHQKQ